jgi:hypothetical protein
VVDAELVRRTLTNPINNETSNFLCLDYKVSQVSQEENPEGWKVYQMLAKGKRRLGASVTVLLLEKSEQPNGRRSIKRVYYLETSMVGIPCNQLSWAALAAKALGIKKWSLPAPAAQIERKSVMDKQVANAPAAEPETAETPNPETTPAAELASKGIYQDRVKAKTSRLYFMFETLSDVIYELKSSAARKIQMDYAAKLQEAIDEFGAALTEAVLPALTAPQDSDSGLAISYYGFTPEDSERLQDQVLSKMVAEMGGGLEFLTKAGKRNNKKDQERIQAMHDHCAELGAKCMESKSADDSDSKAAPVASVSTETDSVPASPVAIGELETKVASLQGAVTSKEAEIAEKDKTIKDLQDQNNQWLACSLAAKAAMKQVLDQPQPRAGQ